MEKPFNKDPNHEKLLAPSVKCFFLKLESLDRKGKFICSEEWVKFAQEKGYFQKLAIIGKSFGYKNGNLELPFVNREDALDFFDRVFNKK